MLNTHLRYSLIFLQFKQSFRFYIECVVNTLECFTLDTPDYCALKLSPALQNNETLKSQLIK